MLLVYSLMLLHESTRNLCRAHFLCDLLFDRHGEMENPFRISVSIFHPAIGKGTHTHHVDFAMMMSVKPCTD